jgi:SAM-dependent methyltransferase
MTLNPYEDDLSAVLAELGGHRHIIGGLWDEMGEHQRAYLVSQGLLPGDRLLDIGCGSLRAGVKLVPFLDPGHYHGIDLVPALLDDGYAREILPLGLAARLPRENLAAADAFQIPFAGIVFDHALAQSLFSHLPINHLRLCLYNLRPRMRQGGVFHATFFTVPDDHNVDASCVHPPAGVTTFGWRDPYHFYARDIAFAAENLGWRCEGVFDWDHPRGQKIARFHAI